MHNALITGASGFCARHLANRLISEGGIRVIGLDLHAEPPKMVSLDDYIQVDICDFGQLSSAISLIQPDLIFHLAGLVEGAAADIYRTNFIGTIHLLESVREYKPDARVLLVGTAAEYGFVEKSDLPVKEDHPCCPVSPYGISKYAATLAGLNYAKRLGMKIVVSRPFNIIGAGVPKSLVVGALLARIKVTLQSQADTVVQVGNLDSRRDFLAVNDVVEAYLRMINGNFWGEVFNICSERAYSIRKIAELLLSHSTCRINMEVDPALVRSSEVDILYGSNEKARRCFGFNPNTDLADALKSSWNYEIERIE